MCAKDSGGRCGEESVYDLPKKRWRWIVDYWEDGWHLPRLKVFTYILLGAIFSGRYQVLVYVFLHILSTQVLVGVWVVEGAGTRVILQYSRIVFVSTINEAFYWCSTRSLCARVPFSEYRMIWDDKKKSKNIANNGWTIGLPSRTRVFVAIEAIKTKITFFSKNSKYFYCPNGNENASTAR